MAAKLAPTLFALAALILTARPAGAAVGNGQDPRSSTGGNPGMTSQTLSLEDTEIAALKADVAKLTSQVSALQSQLTSLQSNVQAFHTQFDKHTHSFGPNGIGILTILNCPGYGQACTSATPMKEITVLTPEQGVPGVTSSPLH